MNYLFAAAATTGTVYYLWNEWPTVASKLIDLYVDVKHTVSPPTTGADESKVPPPRVESRKGYTFLLYQNYIVWHKSTENAPAHDKGWTRDGQLVKFRVVSGPQDELLCSTLSRFAGPDGDFDGKVPPIEAINTYLNKYYTGPILVENDNFEEFVLQYLEK